MPSPVAGGYSCPVFVLVRDGQISAFGDGEWGQKYVFAAYRDGSRGCAERRVGGALVEQLQLIAAQRDVADFKRAVLLRDVEPRDRQHDNHGAHVGMDVAEDPDGADARERDAARGAGRVEADVEHLAVVVGEGVVEDGVEVGEFHRGADGNGQNVGCERLVFLHHPRAGSGGLGRRFADRFEPGDDTGVVELLAHRGVARVAQLHAPGDGSGRERQREQAKKDTPERSHSAESDECRSRDRWCGPGRLRTPPARSSPVYT